MEERLYNYGRILSENTKIVCFVVTECNSIAAPIIQGLFDRTELAGQVAVTYRIDSSGSVRSFFDSVKDAIVSLGVTFCYSGVTDVFRELAVEYFFTIVDIDRETRVNDGFFLFESISQPFTFCCNGDDIKTALGKIENDKVRFDAAVSSVCKSLVEDSQQSRIPKNLQVKRVH